MYSYKIGISAEEHDNFANQVTKQTFYNHQIGQKLKIIGITNALVSTKMMP